jgi:hypothetical protein
MAEYDYVDHSGSATDYYGQGVGNNDKGKAFCVRRRINMATAGDALTSTGAFSAADIINVFNVTEGMLVLGCAIRVITAEGATATVDVGDGDDDDGFLTAANLNSAAWYPVNSTYGGAYVGLNTPSLYCGKTYITSDTIDLVVNNNSTDVAVFDLYVYGIDFGYTPSA